MLTLREQLLIVPTRLEQSCVQDQLDSLRQAGLNCETCGVGLVESAVSVARMISVYKPMRIWLIGIAGCLSDRLEIGQAYEFGTVSCYGIGVGDGVRFQMPNELGWQNLMKFANSDCLKIDGGSDEALMLLSVTAASATLDEAERKKARFPKAAAEDMEAYAIALQCQTYGIQCRVIRGISNRAGDRNHSQWKIQQAMNSAIQLCSARINEEQ